MRPIIALLALVATTVSAASTYNLCATDDMLYTKCKALQRADSQVVCLQVADKAECAIKLASGLADFGFFNAEELLLTYHFFPNDSVPVFELRHKDRVQEDFEFQTVAVIPARIKGPLVNFRELKNGGFCHPGFSETGWFNDYILKYFERKVIDDQCDSELSIAENEAKLVYEFFGKSCRAGQWAKNSEFDQVLKQKRYPQLCELCDDVGKCKYNPQFHHGHIGALECLSSGRGSVAYVALQYVREYLEKNDFFNFLCTDGTTQPLSTEKPCAWISQPWPAIIVRKPIAEELTRLLKEWLAPALQDSWVTSLRKIVEDIGIPKQVPSDTNVESYIRKGRDPNVKYAHTCDNDNIAWCTIGQPETTKCRWIAKAAENLGIEPRITCARSNSTFQCFKDIKDYQADIITIDSNYGHLARTVYGLRTVLYSGTANDRSSKVIAVVRNDDDSITSFKSLKGRIACFPEYGGIAWMSFVHTLRTSGVITSKSCNYPKLMANYLSGACTPGIKDADHLNRTLHYNDYAPQLCSACLPDETEKHCAADPKNAYYGDNGALECLNNNGGIAIVEMYNLKGANIKQNDYRVLCKNGSLANSSGFDVDDECALSVTIDSEIVGRMDATENENLDTTNALLKIDDWLGFNVHDRRPISIYQDFNGTTDLLFKNSTSGLEMTSSSISTVLAYKDLFRHVETCSGALNVAANFGMILFVALTIPFARHL